MTREFEGENTGRIIQSDHPEGGLMGAGNLLRSWSTNSAITGHRGVPFLLSSEETRRNDNRNTDRLR